MAWYDVLPWANNLINTRVIPYSGEKDKQRQAADRVIALTESLGIKILRHRQEHGAQDR